jgi:hypothetical protein
MKVDIKEGLAVDITLNRAGTPPGKLADAVLYFTAGPLEGLCIPGFAVWERRENTREINVTVPNRQFIVRGETRSYNLIRPSDPTRPAQDAPPAERKAYYAPMNRLQDRIARAYADVISLPEENGVNPADIPESDDIPF